MEAKINSELVDAITLLFPNKKSCVDFVATTLSIGKSSAMRRLNKEVLFSYGEAVILAHELNISLDNLLISNNIYINLAHNNIEKEPVDFSQYVLESQLALYEQIEDIGEVKLNIACNIIPYSVLLKYDNLYRFYIYKKYFQNITSLAIKAFSESKIPASHKTLRKRLETRMGSIDSITIIFDKHIISNIVDDILYFKELELLKYDDLTLLKTDLMEFIKDIEIICTTGKNKAGNKAYIYISDISLDASYAYIDTSNSKYLQIQMHSMNIMTSMNPLFVSMQEEWINSVKKYSTLISKGGDVEKKIFFDQQKEYCRKIITLN